MSKKHKKVPTKMQVRAGDAKPSPANLAALSRSSANSPERNPTEATPVSSSAASGLSWRQRALAWLRTIHAHPKEYFLLLLSIVFGPCVPTLIARHDNAKQEEHEQTRILSRVLIDLGYDDRNARADRILLRQEVTMVTSSAAILNEPLPRMSLDAWSAARNRLPADLIEEMPAVEYYYDLAADWNAKMDKHEQLMLTANAVPMTDRQVFIDNAHKNEAGMFDYLDVFDAKNLEAKGELLRVATEHGLTLTDKAFPDPPVFTLKGPPLNVANVGTR